MGFIKVVKNKAYFKRFQVKYRRRREGKTDYQQRRKLITQDKTKFNTPKYRFVVRITNRDVVCQIVYAKISGDYVLCAAYSHELPRFGLPVGLTNYSAAYATGLLLARRVLNKLKLGEKYQGQTNVNGEDYQVEPLTDGPRPFRALLDVGLRRTTTGSKVFAALKGVTDGGVDVPHSVSRFAGFDSESKKLKADVLRKRIFGGHVGDYMKHLQSADAEIYKARFSQYIKNKINPSDIEKLYQTAHKAIRSNPDAQKKEAKKVTAHKRYSLKKLTKGQRDGNVKMKKHRLQEATKKMEAAAGAESDEGED